MEPFPFVAFLRTESDRHRSSSGTVLGIDGQLAALFRRHLPGQERIDVGRDLAAVFRTTLQVPRQPGADIDLRHAQGGEQGKEHRRQPTAP